MEHITHGVFISSSHEVLTYPRVEETFDKGHFYYSLSCS